MWAAIRKKKEQQEKEREREREGKNFRTLEKCSDSPNRHFAMSWTLISNWKQSLTPSSQFLYKDRNSTSDNTNTHTNTHTYICIYDHFHDWPTWTHNFNGHMYVVCSAGVQGGCSEGCRVEVSLRGLHVCGHNIWPCPGFHSECVWWINDAAWNFQWFALVSLCFAFSLFPRSPRSSSRADKSLDSKLWKCLWHYQVIYTTR